MDLPELYQTEAFQAISVIPIFHEGRIIACFIIASRTMLEVPRATRYELEAITAADGKRHSPSQSGNRAPGSSSGTGNACGPTDGRTSANQQTVWSRELRSASSAEEGMKRSLKEKDALLQEVHHRVKNNLQIISSLLALQRSHVKDDTTLGLLKDSQSRIRSMAFIHEHLYQSTDLSRIDFVAYIKDLTGGPPPILFGNPRQSIHETGRRAGLSRSEYGPAVWPDHQ